MTLEPYGAELVGVSSFVRYLTVIFKSRQMLEICIIKKFIAETFLNI